MAAFTIALSGYDIAEVDLFLTKGGQAAASGNAGPCGPNLNRRTCADGYADTPDIEWTTPSKT